MSLLNVQNIPDYSTFYFSYLLFLFIFSIITNLKRIFYNHLEVHFDISDLHYMDKLCFIHVHIKSTKSIYPRSKS